jgi:hypothetical protein
MLECPDRCPMIHIVAFCQDADGVYPAWVVRDPDRATAEALWKIAIGFYAKPVYRGVITPKPNRLETLDAVGRC